LCYQSIWGVSYDKIFWLYQCASHYITDITLKRQAQDQQLLRRKTDQGPVVEHCGILNTTIHSTCLIVVIQDTAPIYIYGVNIMALILVSYDLNKKKDYPKLYDAIKNLGTWAHPVDSTWLVSTIHTQQQVKDHLKQFIDSDDQLVIVKISGTVATHNVDPLVTDWLKRNLA